MNLLIDAVFFQFASNGIARVWNSILEQVVQSENVNLFILDRGNAPKISGATMIPFPSYDLSRHSAADSFVIQDICDLYKIDVFSSTYYTTPVHTPSCLVVYDMIPELLGFDLSHRDWKEKKVAILYSHAQISISENTRSDLLKFYPALDPDRSSFCHLSTDKSIFKPRTEAEIKNFLDTNDISLPYFLFVGSRQQHNNYKNAKLFFDAIAEYKSFDFEVICVGGEKTFEQDVQALQKRGLKVRRLELEDDALAAAYTGALALVYPSLYEGFGLPVLEAMGSGCPVITTNLGSLKEVAGNAGLLVKGNDAVEMRDALETVRQAKTRQVLIANGLKNAQKFDWAKFATHFVTTCKTLERESKSGAYNAFFERWSTLRKLQADVDYA